MIKLFPLCSFAHISTGAIAHAKDIIRCVAETEQLAVFEVADGYEFLFQTPQSYRRERIERDTVDGKPDGRPAMTFKNKEVSIIHLFGECDYFSNDEHARFPDSSCRIDP
jgi:hypothetical protein